MYTLRLHERHGYDIRRQVEAISGGTIRLGPGATYSTLRRLLNAGFIAEVADRPNSDLDDPRRRYYRLTEQGRADLVQELERMDHGVARSLAHDVSPGPN
jgi:DNA-binding PadR family transcriptional regulator